MKIVFLHFWYEEISLKAR